MNSIVVVSLLVVVAPYAGGQSGRTPQRADSSCAAAYDSLQTIFRRDYPGYSEKTARAPEAFRTLTDSLRAIARSSDDFRVCIPALQRWTAFFADPHVMVWQAAAPSPGASVAPIATQALDAGLRPSIALADSDAVILRIPTFDVAYKASIDSLVARAAPQLAARPLLLVDLRGNSGGCSCSYESLSPYLYSGPVKIYGSDIRASDANRAYVRQLLNDAGQTPAMLERARAALARMESNPGQFVEWSSDSLVTRREVLAMPRAVALLVDERCASSCEGFVIESRQSRKVVIAGARNTRGAADYGNVRALWLPGWRQLRIPAVRSHWLRDSLPLDHVGIAPDLRIPADEVDPVSRVLRELRRRR